MDILQNKTQKDIENAPVTSKEFHEAMALVATKDQVEELKDKMEDEFEKVERRFGNIEATMATKKDISTLTNTVEKVLKKYTDNEIEQTTHAENHKNVDDNLEDHENRIADLEAAPAPAV